MQPPSRLKRFIGTLVIGGSALFVIFVSLFPNALNPVPITSGPLAHDVYVWQRARSTELNEAISSATTYRRILLLGGQIQLNERGAEVRVNDVDPAPLAGRTVTLVIRIEPHAGAIADRDVIDRVLGGIQQIVDAATRTPIIFDELQIDFDPAESQLHAYREWLLAVKRQFPSYRLSCTTLISHVDGAGFARVVRAVDSFVLQLHALPPNPTPAGPISLLDPDRARAAIVSAARLRVDFSVALPTYSYRLLFDGSGKLVRVLAEQDRDEPPPADGSSRVVRADPAQIAAFVQSLQTERPEPLKAIAWYRLPIATDQHNWHHETLDAVRTGAAPVGRIEAGVNRPQPALVEIELINSGNDDAPLPAAVRVTATGTVLAFDAIGGFRVQRERDKVLQFSAPEGTIPPLRPKQRRTIGWVRLDSDTEVAIDVLTPSPSP